MTTLLADRITSIKSVRLWTQKDWYLLATIFALAIAVNLSGLGSYGLMDPSEGFYAEGAREMLENGNYVVPHLNYAPWFEKPGLIFWLIASSYKLFGVTEFASRIPSALMASTLVAFLFSTCRLFVNRRAALLSAFILLSSPLFITVSHLALTDMSFGTLVSISLLSFFAALEAGKRSYTWIGYISAGLAVLCKGPLGLLFIGLTLIAYLIVQTRSIPKTWSRIISLNPLAGLLIVLGMALPWYIAVHMATDGAFSREFFLEQNLGRLGKTAGVVSHPNPFWFYIPVIVGGFFPWCLYLLGALTTFQKRVFNNKVTQRSKLLVFAACWTVSITLFLSAASSKLPTYIVPVFPALAILTGASLDLLIRTKAQRTFAWIAGLASISLAVSIFVLPRALAGRTVDNTTLFLQILLALACITQIGYWLLIKQNRSGIALRLLTLGTTLVMGLSVPFSMSLHYEHRQAEMHRLVLLANQPGSTVASIYRIVPTAMFYLHKPIPIVKDVASIKSFMQAHPDKQCLLLSKGKMEEKFASIFPATTLVKQDNRWFLYRLPDQH